MQIQQIFPEYILKTHNRKRYKGDWYTLQAEEIQKGVSGSCYIRREVNKLVYQPEEGTEFGYIGRNMNIGNSLYFARISVEAVTGNVVSTVWHLSSTKDELLVDGQALLLKSFQDLAYLL